MANINASTIEAAIPFIAGIAGLVLGFRTTAASTPRSERAKQVLRWTGPALIAFAIFLFMTGSTPESAHAEAVVTAMKAKLSLPVQVDEDTRLDDVRAMSDKEIGYFLTLTTVTETQLSDNPLAQQLEGNLRGGACQNLDYAKMFKAGISLRIAYQTVDHAEVIQIVMAPEDCGY